MTHLCFFVRYTYIVARDVWLAWCWSPGCETWVLVEESWGRVSERRIQLTTEWVYDAE